MRWGRAAAGVGGDRSPLLRMGCGGMAGAGRSAQGRNCAAGGARRPAHPRPCCCARWLRRPMERAGREEGVGRCWHLPPSPLPPPASAPVAARWRLWGDALGGAAVRRWGGGNGWRVAPLPPLPLVPPAPVCPRLPYRAPLMRGQLHACGGRQGRGRARARGAGGRPRLQPAAAARARSRQHATPRLPHYRAPLAPWHTHFHVLKFTARPPAACTRLPEPPCACAQRLSAQRARSCCSASPSSPTPTPLPARARAAFPPRPARRLTIDLHSVPRARRAPSPRLFRRPARRLTHAAPRQHTSSDPPRRPRRSAPQPPSRLHPPPPPPRPP
jgi:hypothetical protein